MIELEKTYLAKFLPEGLFGARSREIFDSYIPASKEHPILRLRQKGDRYEITKKSPINIDDKSAQKESTISLDQKEFEALRCAESKDIHKTRYFYEYEGKIFEFDIFLDDLKGLVTVDIEFETEYEKDTFVAPDFCLADVTQEDFIAGGKICGKSYQEIEPELNRFEYKNFENK